MCVLNFTLTFKYNHNLNTQSMYRLATHPLHHKVIPMPCWTQIIHLSHHHHHLLNFIFFTHTHLHTCQYTTQNLSLQFIEITLYQDCNTTPTQRKRKIQISNIGGWYVTLTTRICEASTNNITTLFEQCYIPFMSIHTCNTII